MNTLKLFIWDDVLSDYTSGIIVALAHDLFEARRVVLASLTEDWERPRVERAIADEPAVFEVPVARVVYGGG